MATIGEQLTQAREAKKVSQRQAAAETKINPKFILALESDNYTAFNEEFYIKQYIRTYADYLGLNAIPLLAIIDEDTYEEKGEIHVSQLLFEQKKKATERTQRQFKTMDILQKIFFIVVVFAVLLTIWFLSVTFMPKREFQSQSELATTTISEQ